MNVVHFRRDLPLGHVLDVVHELHLWHPDVLELPDRPDHTQQKQQKQETGKQ